MKINTTLFDFDVIVNIMTYSEMYSFLEQLNNSYIDLEMSLSYIVNEDDKKDMDLQLAYLNLNIDTFIEAMNEHEIKIVKNIEIDYEEYQLCLN